MNMIIILISILVTVCGICSFQPGHSYEVVNQYGETIKMWGAGIYAHDSYFKAPIFIGSDATILVLVIPFAVLTFLRLRRHSTLELYIQNFSIMCLLLYYSASLAFGVTYNHLHLLYIALFGACFYYTGILFMKLYDAGLSKNTAQEMNVSKGTVVYLVIAGFSLFVAWLPDIITSLVNGTSLDLIEVYTTEITYVIDMGIISPLMFLTLYLLKHQHFMGYVLLRMIFKVCIVVGIMLPVQTIFQMVAGISIPVPALITKVLIFTLLAFFALFFERKYKHST